MGDIRLPVSRPKPLKTFTRTLRLSRKFLQGFVVDRTFNATGTLKLFLGARDYPRQSHDNCNERNSDPDNISLVRYRLETDSILSLDSSIAWGSSSAWLSKRTVMQFVYKYVCLFLCDLLLLINFSNFDLRGIVLFWISLQNFSVQFFSQQYYVFDIFNINLIIS